MSIGTEDSTNVLTYLGHLFSGGILVGTSIGIIPSIAGVLTIAWIVLQVYESKTFQKWIRTRRLRRISRLKIEMERLDALELVDLHDSHGDMLPAQLAAAELLLEARKQAKNVLKTAVDAVLEARNVTAPPK